MSVQEQVFSLFLLIACGYLSSKAKWISPSGFQGLNQVVLNFSLPCLTISKLQQTVDKQITGQLAMVFLLGGAMILLCGAITAFLFRHEDENRQAILTNMGMFSNAGFMGFPVLTAVLGAEYLIYGVAYLAIFNLLCWSIGPILFPQKQFSWKTLYCNPTLLASIFGLILFIIGWKLPAFITTAMDWMGNTTTPLAMLIVGAKLCFLHLNDFKDFKVLIACGLRLVCFPLLALGLLSLLGLSFFPKATIALCTAMPCAATLTVQAESCGGNSLMASKAVALSTALSILTIPLFTFFFRC